MHRTRALLDLKLVVRCIESGTAFMHVNSSSNRVWYLAALSYVCGPSNQLSVGHPHGAPPSAHSCGRLPTVVEGGEGQMKKLSWIPVCSSLVAALVGATACAGQSGDAE